MEELRWGDRILTDLYEEALEVSSRDYPRLVIFSDLHLGDGSGRDDFVKNENLMCRVLEDYYLKKDFALVLNGDIEELQKFRLSRIRERYRGLYRLWDRFQEKKALFKTVGNHDGLLQVPGAPEYPYPIHTALRIETGHRPLFIFHGHQAAPLYTRFNDLFTFLLRYLAAPLGIKNIPLKQTRKQYKIEKRVYRFSRRAKVASVIGHTHRPLFESLSKADSLKFSLERLLRGYRSVAEGEKATPCRFPACSTVAAASENGGLPVSRSAAAASPWCIGTRRGRKRPTLPAKGRVGWSGRIRAVSGR